MTDTKGKLSAQVAGAEALTDDSLKFEYVTSLLRALLIEAAFSAIEFVDAEGDPEEHPRIIDQARKLLAPVDGDLATCLDDLLPMVHLSGWKGACITWFEKRVVEGVVLPPLREDLRRWVAFRNDRPGHGVVAKNVVDENLPWLLALLRRLAAELDDLLPVAIDQTRLGLKLPSGVTIPITSLRLVDSAHVLVRKLQRRGTDWRITAQTVDPVHSAESTITIPADAAIPRLSSESRSMYVTPCVWVDGKKWSPNVLLPRRATSVFVGREKEYDELREWFNDPTSRACLIFGEGGIGKTTLVLEFLNDVIEGHAGSVTWKPDIICFYSAKQTLWTAAGLERLHGVFPALSEAIRDLIRVYEEHPGKDWYAADIKGLLGRAEGTFRDLGLGRDSILLVLDNTETLASRREDEAEVSKVLSAISRKLCRVMITSRRHERVEAHPLEVPALTEAEGASLLRQLGENFGAKPLIQAGDAKRRAMTRSLAGRPILLEVLARYASHPGRSLDEALEFVHKDAQRDLGNFLFQDAWDRIGDQERMVFLVLLVLGSSADEVLLGWICGRARIAATVWEDAFAETRFGSLREYGTHYDVVLDPAAQDFLASKLSSIEPGEQRQVRAAAAELEGRYRKLQRADDHEVSDRVSDAFSSAPAKLAKMAAYRGDLEEAAEWYEEAVRVDHGNAALWDRYAWFLLMRTRDLSRAKACAAQAVKLSPGEADPAFTAGMVAARLGDVEGADAQLMRAAQLGKPGHLCRAQQARARVHAFDLELTTSPAGLNEAQELLRQAEQITVRSDLDEKHLRECRTTRRRITEMFEAMRRRDAAIARLPSEDAG